ncbi:hypothetical protein [Micromonospora rifamycinica]|uniref:Uncharacterized protein n=1 Tax=Micromonospora rifamycinica TaxID=291594 RepID=A0A109IFK6_9ACTN|nr:hypothetical protein [Micromonospora rifamycinica]KWV29634.1 hypothetical protein AWV63_27475 [Micromonospora rifamycinica]SCG39590.1 hypothetical protein GA0070623_0566 [Micromonospora rifamycinica]
MVRGSVRALLITAAVSAAGLTVAPPAQAAPASPARQITTTAQITVTSFYAVSDREIQVNGTATCTQPTGTAHLLSTVVQLMPFRLGAGGVDVPCAAGPVAWQVTVYISEGWDSFREVTVNALMTDDYGGSASVSVNGRA